MDKKGKEEKKNGFVPVDTLFVKMEKWYENNRSKINVVSTVFLVVLLLCIYLFVFWAPKRQQKAELAVFKAEQYFAQDSLKQALNGDGVYDGLLDVASRYRCTKTGNRARYEIGVCYMQMGDYEQAVKYLKKFKRKDKLVSVQALGLIGDAYVEMNDLNKALTYYKKAVKLNPNELLTPRYLYRTGLVYEKKGDWKAAVKCYEDLQHSYPNAMESMDIEKRIALAEAKAGK
ncbi:MAG: tetratricopeptide repeat protein [Bacteroidales bacterium]|nr:tetratricopeptide repeat protein [Bacteroidales bacterium]MBP5396834.1 tetratricopeptide repeat protein [Bacteroidales bacterium]MBP5613313.1 tetratricopeptide repeat protein [Bacteroidales bacterium]